MKSKTDLFQLIKAMSKSEKRYFTLDAQKSGRKDARYLELFQAINDMENYDEAALKSHFTNLHTDKAYLYDAILRSMRDYRSANSYAAKIKEMIMDAKYLYERGLYEQSEERILSARALAEELGDQLSALELNKEYRRLLKYVKREGYEMEIDELLHEKDSNLQKLNEELFFLDIHDRLLIEVRKHRQGLSEKEKQVFKNRFHLLISENINLTSLQSTLRYYQCMALFNQLLNNHKEVYNFYSRIVNSWEISPKYKAENFYQYILDTSNLIHILLAESNKSAEINTILSKLEKEKPANLHDQNVLFQRITSYRLLYSINTGDFTEVSALTKRIEKGLRQYDISPDTELSIIFNTAFLLFLAGHHNLCQEWANKIIQQKKLLVRQDIQNVSRVLFLLATLEIGDFDTTEMCLRNTQRYFTKFSKKNSLYINILTFIKKMHSGYTMQNRNVQKQLENYIISLQTNKQSIPLGLDELMLYWLESKSSNRSISEIIKTALTKSNR